MVKVEEMVDSSQKCVRNVLSQELVRLKCGESIVEFSSARFDIYIYILAMDETVLCIIIFCHRTRARYLGYGNGYLQCGSILSKIHLPQVPFCSYPLKPTIRQGTHS